MKVLDVRYCKLDSVQTHGLCAYVLECAAYSGAILRDVLLEQRTRLWLEYQSR
jgi:hypothetical protein